MSAQAECRKPAGMSRYEGAICHVFVCVRVLHTTGRLAQEHTMQGGVCHGQEHNHRATQRMGTNMSMPNHEPTKALPTATAPAELGLCCTFRLRPVKTTGPWSYTPALKFLHCFFYRFRRSNTLLREHELVDDGAIGRQPLPKDNMRAVREDVAVGPRVGAEGVPRRRISERVGRIPNIVMARCSYGLYSYGPIELWTSTRRRRR